MKQLRVLWAFLLWMPVLAAAQTGIGFGSVQAVSSNREYGNLPVMNLNSGDRITVSFDDLQDRDMVLRYRVKLLDTDGKPNDMREIEYVSGINKIDITESDYSFNTRSNYAHYSFSFPEKGRNVKLSGAYRFEIFSPDEPDEVLLAVPFMVCEQEVLADIEVKVPRRVEWRRLRQELAVTVDASKSSVRIIQADRCLKVFAQQNMNTQTIRLLPLLYQTGNRYEYRDKDEMVFDGLNEFRNIDIRPINYSGRGVDRVMLVNDRWNAQTLPQQSREYKPYVHDDDIDGNYVIKAEGMENSDIEAEYVNVHFVLQEEYNPLAKYYVIGKFNNWLCTEKNQMEYREGIRAYTLTMPLKQGFYDYMFACQYNGKISIPLMEGNNQETENDYYVYVFYREPGGRYDRLLGVAKANSREK